MRNPEEELLVDQALDNAYESNFNVHPDQPQLDLIYPDLERSKELIEAMKANPELPKYLGGNAIGGADDYFTKTGK